MMDPTIFKISVIPVNHVLKPSVLFNKIVQMWKILSAVSVNHALFLLYSHSMIFTELLIHTCSSI